MICPNCNVQCHQFRKVGHGNVDCDFYDTAEAKECPNCGKVFVEYYAVYEIPKDKGEDSFLFRRIAHTNMDISNLVKKSWQKTKRI